MKAFILCLLLCFTQIMAQIEGTHESRKKWLIEAGSYLNFSPAKTKQSPGFYIGSWYRFPGDETGIHLEIGGNFAYSSSVYDFDYGKRDRFYPVNSKEYMLNLGARMIQGYTSGKTRIEWVTELSFHNLFFDGKGIPDEPREEEDENTIYVNVDAESVATVKIGQGIRFWRNNVGLGVQASYMPYRLWYKNTVPEGFNSFSVEAGIYFKF